MNEELYFKDAFTEVDGSINIDVNNLNTNCITSNNNKFSLDSDGNLIVNSITTLTSNNIDFDVIYPVGSIYLSLVDINPGTLFGGTWESIAKGRTLVGVDSSQTEFNAVKKEGGEKSHKLTINEMPKHRHSYLAHYGKNNTPNSTLNWNLGDTDYQEYVTSETGSSQSHNNLQPYLTCYIWTRIS